MKFRDIKQFKRAYYKVDAPRKYFMGDKLKEWGDIKGGCELNPDFQRGHVWTEEQQSKYVEFILRNGSSGRDIYFNCKGWMRTFEGPMLLVDGLQRVTAARRFLNNKIKAFGKYYKEFEDSLSSFVSFEVYVNNMSDRREVLEWYIELNEGGVVHTKEEIKRVKKLLCKEHMKRNLKIHKEALKTCEELDKECI